MQELMVFGKERNILEKKLDYRIEKTYMGLHNAFTALLGEKRFENITVNELCQKAMIRRTTFYKHFADKYEYFVFYCKEVCESFHSQIPPELFPGNVQNYSLQMCRFLFRFMSEHKQLVNNIKESDLFPTLLYFLSEQITEDLLSAMRQGNSGAEPDPISMESAAAFYSGGFLGMLLHWDKKKYAYDEDLFISTRSRLVAENNHA